MNLPTRYLLGAAHDRLLPGHGLVGDGVPVLAAVSGTEGQRFGQPVGATGQADHHVRVGREPVRRLLRLVDRRERLLDGAVPARVRTRRHVQLGGRCLALGRYGERGTGRGQTPGQ
ncbi:hypothetical protein [Streptomyces sp. LUP47B]|uniref:hypothetical protein n=1 Tax=Streptomyces sp. LUP47B TaxID=1890286 RepID=UPI00210CCC68|nr:hypothetical protein [Streptomyces sp. LUP47B]